MSYSYDWTRKKFLGAGSYGEVWRVDRIDESISERKTIAVKIVPRSLDGDGVSRTELKALKELSQPPNIHEHVMQFYGHYDSETHSFYEFEYVEGDLWHRMLSASQSGMMIPEHTTALIASKILKGLEYMHKKGFVHQDLKPENILVTHDFRKIKIADLGATIQLPTGKKFMYIREVRTTYDYCGPEVFEKILGHVSDIWSLGIIVFELCFRGNHPFRGDPFAYVAIRQQEEAMYMNGFQQGGHDWRQMVEERAESKVRDLWKCALRNPILWPEKIEAWDNKYHDARQFIERLLQKDHESRCSAAKALRDKFIRRASFHPHNEHHRQAPQPQYQHQSKRQYTQYQPQPQPQPQPLASARPQSNQWPLWQSQSIPQQQFLQAPQQRLSASGYASNWQQQQQQNHFGQSYSAHSTSAGWGQKQSGLWYGKRKMTDPMRWQPKKPSLLKSLVQGVMPKRYPQGIPTHIPRPPSKLRKSRWK